ncbi:hypothetical protein IEC97_13440 [Neobacillus cucumis]|uniref:hypothetical protein n=1 Tax=Neobacillus cucumis TaxID=1740721 RepID=UPI0018DFFB58|nr:hypothetical protein [Neobacillus cucumis]MBI0578365.1 hypothetical protein [Neobacillus cucumis]
MVTAIVIPVILLYFYLITKKEMKEQDTKWLALENIRQEAVAVGEIKSIYEEKQRYYYHRYIFVQEIKLQTKSQQITVKKMTPLTKTTTIETFKVGEFLKVYGCWESSKLVFSHFERI